MAQNAAHALNGKRASLGEVRGDTAQRAHAAPAHGQDARSTGGVRSRSSRAGRAGEHEIHINTVSPGPALREPHTGSTKESRPSKQKDWTGTEGT